MSDDGDAPGPTQDPLPLHPAHVVHVRVVFGETKDLFHLRAPQVVVLAPSADGQRAHLPLSDGVGLGRDGANFVKLRHASDFQTILQRHFVVQRRRQRPVHAGEVSPEVSRSVSRTDFHCVNENGITLQESADV